MPQKGEHDHDYNINPNYFEAVLRQTISELLEKGYIALSVRDGVDDGDAQVFSLTDMGARYLEEMAASIEQ